MVQAPSAAYSSEEMANRNVVLDYYEKLIGRWDFAAASVHLGDHLIQHNPTIPDGLDGLKAWISNVPPQIAATLKHRIVRVLVDGDMVMIHGVTTLPGTPDTIMVDLFRLENRKIVEHWDVIQQAPAEAAHANGMV